MTRIERLILRWFQRRCSHPGGEVKADLGQADYRPLMVTWCATCGAIALNDQAAVDKGEWSELRRPEPTWVAGAQR
jgi:hypothetical protein